MWVESVFVLIKMAAGLLFRRSPFFFVAVRPFTVSASIAKPQLGDPVQKVFLDKLKVNSRMTDG